jgi:ubiquinone/menaquinone biosynthesis C-methylase UbiE
MSENAARVCPAEHAGGLMLPIRRFIHHPEKILGPLIEGGQIVMDLGCGPGYFTIPIAKMVGPEGRVIAVDLQPAMLELLRANAERAGMADRICPHQCSIGGIGAVDPVDFAIAFCMLHEVPSQERFLAEVRSLVKPGGRFLLVEPKGHVSKGKFERSAEIARWAGFVPLSAPRIAFSRSVLFARE